MERKGHYIESMNELISYDKTDLPWIHLCDIKNFDEIDYKGGRFSIMTPLKTDMTLGICNISHLSIVEYMY